MQQSLKNQIDRGAKWLDEIRPGWAAQIDVSELNMALPRQCILGQLFTGQAQAAGYHGSGWGFMDKLHSDDWVLEYGFVEGAPYWIEKINERLAVTPTVPVLRLVA